MLFLILSLMSAWAHTDDYPRLSTPAYLSEATGFELPAQAANWPVNVQSIGHTNASYQNYGGTPYFHHGLDIRANALESVYASRGGRVVNIENYATGPLYWEIAILDEDGYIWQYHHVKRSTIPAEIFAAFQNGTSISDGTKIGEVVEWPVTTYGERYHHIHLNILDGSRKYLSPFLFLLPLNDVQAPQIIKVGLLQNGRALSGTVASGSYSLYAEINDLIMHQQFIVPPHLITVEMDGVSKVVWRFDQLPGGADEEKDVDVFYVKSMVCGNYECRKPIIDLGYKNPFTRQVGRHEVKVKAWDFVGNSAEKSFNWEVR